jgi:hypothetical protein
MAPHSHHLQGQSRRIAESSRLMQEKSEILETMFDYMGKQKGEEMLKIDMKISKVEVVEYHK